MRSSSRHDGFEVREIEQDLGTFKDIVDGYLEIISTYCCTFWCNKEGMRLEMPFNALAKYLWWTLSREMEGRDIFRGPVFITGLPDETSDSLPVPDDVVGLFHRVERLAH